MLPVVSELLVKPRAESHRTRTDLHTLGRGTGLSSRHLLGVQGASSETLDPASLQPRQEQHGLLRWQSEGLFEEGEALQGYLRNVFYLRSE